MSKAKTPKSTSEAPNEVIIRGTPVPFQVRNINHSALKFFLDNPRIYSVAHANGKSPTQEEIEEYLQKQDHVKELKEGIKENGGVIQELYVKDGSLEVIEGNRRLAAFKLLAKADPLKWITVKCKVLPQDLDDSLLHSLLSDIHLKGQRAWSPYEKAAFLQRRFKKDKVGMDKLKDEFGMSKQKIKHSIAVVDLMDKYDEEDTRRWSFYDEFVKLRKAQEICVEVPDFEEKMVAKIQDDKVGTAMEFRNRMRVIVNSGSKKIIAKLAEEKCDFEEVYDEAQKTSGNNRAFRTIKKFANWLAGASTKIAVRNSPAAVREDLAFELGKIEKQAKSLRTSIES